MINQAPEFLRFLSASGIAVGSVATVVSNTPEAGIVRLDLGRRTVDLGYSAAGQLLVEPIKR